MLGYHRRNAHHAHHQENQEENHGNHQHWHTTPLRPFCLAIELASVIAVTGGCEPGRSITGSAAARGQPRYWCEGGDSNPHGFPRQILSLVCLPIPPLSHEQLTGDLQMLWQFWWHFASDETPPRCRSSPGALRRSAGDRGQGGHISSSSGSSYGP